MKYVFRQKAIMKKAAWHKRYLRPLAVWLVKLDPEALVLNGLGIALVFFFARVLFINFYMLFVYLPWAVAGGAVLLAALSHVLKQGE